MKVILFLGLGEWRVTEWGLSGPQASQPCPLTYYSCDVMFSFVGSPPLKENRNHQTINRSSLWTKDLLFFAASYFYLCCLITSAALFREIIFLVLNNSWPRSNSNLPLAHLAGWLPPWGQLSKNLLVILTAPFYCDLWILLLSLVSPCPKSKF